MAGTKEKKSAEMKVDWRDSMMVELKVDLKVDPKVVLMVRLKVDLKVDLKVLMKVEMWETQLAEQKVDQ